MTRYTISLAALALAVSLQAGAQGAATMHRTVPENRLARAEVNYLACLRSDNTGLVESGMGQILRFKALYPERGLTLLRTKLEELSVSHPSLSVRFKAYLAVAALESPSLLASAERTEGATDDELFSAVALRLQETLLGYSAQHALRVR